MGESLCLSSSVLLTQILDSKKILAAYQHLSILVEQYRYRERKQKWQIGRIRLFLRQLIREAGKGLIHNLDTLINLTKFRKNYFVRQKFLAFNVYKIFSLNMYPTTEAFSIRKSNIIRISCFDFFVFFIFSRFSKMYFLTRFSK